MTALPDTIENHAAQGVLALHWPDGRSARVTHARLRAACPCSECRARRRAGIEVREDAGVRLDAIEPVGAYALNLAFSDGHRRGIYRDAGGAGLSERLVGSGSPPYGC